MRAGPVIALLYCFAVAGSISGLAQPSNTLQPPSAFAGISDPPERSRAIFGEVAKMLTHPRCMNCHPATDRVLQGNDSHPHQPVATRQTPCVTCHIDRNFTLHERASYRSIPGHPRWMAAPIEMAWEGKSVGEIAGRSRTPTAMAAVTFRSCTSTWRTTIWWHGVGSRARDAILPPARRNCWAN
jgi:hypothetical protein